MTYSNKIKEGWILKAHTEKKIGTCQILSRRDKTNQLPKRILW